MTVDEKKNLIRSFLVDAYDARLIVLRNEADELNTKRMALEDKFRYLKKLRDDVDHNVNRANENDLGALKFFFTGTST